MVFGAGVNLSWVDNGNKLAINGTKLDSVNKSGEAFSPDFYLPQQDLYVELTTLRPQLTRLKNKKLRRLKELYPGINVKLFKRQDLQDLMVKYGLDHEADKINGTKAQEKQW